MNWREAEIEMLVEEMRNMTFPNGQPFFTGDLYQIAKEEQLRRDAEEKEWKAS